MVADAVPEIKDVYVIQIRDHRFHPERLLVPAGRKIKLRVENLDATPEEFESYDFNREKIVKGGGKITVYVGPLKPGEYTFFGEFHPETAQGVLVAKTVPDDKNKK
ncbi:MAG: cupredoxin domain-containing protein [Candidatus Krumholzibacteria bacterium]|nr:cupredoxin domain-containing protein [Candidatus Krumholzibacteria bacterium]